MQDNLYELLTAKIHGKNKRFNKGTPALAA
jgi:hypothetical protein